MKKTFTVAMAAASLLALSSCRQTSVGANDAGNVTAENAAGATAAAGGSIDGTWKTDASTIKTERVTRPPARLASWHGRCLHD